MFVVLQVTKVVKGEMREICTRIMKAKHRKVLVEGFLNTLLSPLRNFLASRVSVNKQCAMALENKCHNALCWQPFHVTEGCSLPALIRPKNLE
jgi:hypothetical protein